jgi:hypothetical protein
VIGCIVMGAILQRAVLFIDEQVCWCRAELVRQVRVGSAWQRRANYTAPILDFFEPPLSAWYRCLALRVALVRGGVALARGGVALARGGVALVRRPAADVLASARVLPSGCAPEWHHAAVSEGAVGGSKSICWHDGSVG